MPPKPARAAKQTAAQALTAHSSTSSLRNRKRKSEAPDTHSVTTDGDVADLESLTGTESVQSQKPVKRTRSSLAGGSTPGGGGGGGGGGPTSTPAQERVINGGFTPINAAVTPFTLAKAGAKAAVNSFSVGNSGKGTGVKRPTAKTPKSTGKAKDTAALPIRTKGGVSAAVLPTTVQVGGYMKGGDVYGKGNVVGLVDEEDVVEGGWDDVPEKIPEGEIRWLTLMAPKESVRKYCINPNTGLPPSPEEDESLFILQRFTYVPRPPSPPTPRSSALDRAVGETIKKPTPKSKSLANGKPTPNGKSKPAPKTTKGKGKGKQSTTNTPEPARPQTPVQEKIHVPYITEYGYRRLMRIYRELDNRVPELNDIPFIYRDFAGYGAIEVLENEISDYEQMTKGGYVPIENCYHIVEGLVFFLSTPQSSYWQKIDDTDRVCEILWLTSHLFADFHARFLAGSTPTVLQAVEYTYRNIGLLIGQMIYLLHQWRFEVFSSLSSSAADGRIPDPTRELRTKMETNAVWSRVPLYAVNREDGKCRRWVGLDSNELALLGAKTGLKAVQGGVDDDERGDVEEEVDVVPVGGEFEKEWKGYTHGYGSGGKNFDLTREGLNKAVFKLLQV